MRLSDLKSHGVNPATLSRLVEKGVLHRPSRGLCELVDADIEISHSFAEVAKRVPKAVICLISALQFYDITLQLSRSVWIAIRSKDRKPAMDYPPIRVVRFGEDALTYGVETHTIDSVPVRIFDPAKSIVEPLSSASHCWSTRLALTRQSAGSRSLSCHPSKTGARKRNLTANGQRVGLGDEKRSERARPRRSPFDKVASKQSVRAVGLLWNRSILH